MKITKQQLKELIKEELSNILEISENKNTRFVVRAFSNNPRKRGEALLFQVIANSAEEAIEIAKASSQTDNSQPIEIAHEYMTNEADGHQMAVEKVKEEVESTINEDGHQDVPSARRAMKTIIEDAGQMLQALEQIDGHLPTWWTNKMAVAANNLNKMRDYLLVPSSDLRDAAENIADLKFADRMRDREN
jgi:hypothetical protein